MPQMGDLRSVRYKLAQIHPDEKGWLYDMYKKAIQSSRGYLYADLAVRERIPAQIRFRNFIAVIRSENEMKDASDFYEIYIPKANRTEEK